MKKILCIVQLPPPLHGVSLMNSYVVNSIKVKQAFSIGIIELKFARTIQQLEKFSFSKILPVFTYAIKIIRMIIHYKPHLIYFTLTPTGLAFYRDAFYVFLLKFFSSEIVLHLHGKGIKKNVINNPIKRKIYSLVFKNTHIICLSEILSIDIKDVYKSKPYIVPNGIQVQPQIDGKLFIANKPILQILYLSNYIKNKGMLVLIEALIILKKKDYIFKARFVGAPSDLTVEKLKELISDHNLTDFAEIIGPLYGNDKFDELRKADIFVFPTYNDSFPLVTLEAMQFGLPIVSTYEGSIPDIVINEKTGFIVDTRNAEMLALKIEILLKDKDLRINMGKQGYERFMSNYTLAHFEDNIFKTFQKILTA